MKHFEFWNPRVFESPYYTYLVYLCLKNRLPFQALAKANYALDHGEIGIGSKLQTQLAFAQDFFLPAELIPAQLDSSEKALQMQRFAQQHGYPIILKPDMGCVGKGVRKLRSAEDIPALASELPSDYMIQKFTPHNYECGVFFVRHSGRSFISGINRKHFPTVVGDSKRSLQQLAEAHPRFTAHWDLFLQYLDTGYVPARGEQVQLSFIGSHTMGCKFTNDDYLINERVLHTVQQIAASQPGFNFGRLDVKAQSEQHFLAGDFVVIEVNGVASLPTHMFDPAHSLSEGYRILFEHARHLLAAASEHRHQPMQLLPAGEIWQRVKQSQASLDAAHQRSLGN